MSGCLPEERHRSPSDRSAILQRSRGRHHGASVPETAIDPPQRRAGQDSTSPGSGVQLSARDGRGTTITGSEFRAALRRRRRRRTASTRSSRAAAKAPASAVRLLACRNLASVGRADLWSLANFQRNRPGRGRVGSLPIDTEMPPPAQFPNEQVVGCDPSKTVEHHARRRISDRRCRRARQQWSASAYLRSGSSPRSRTHQAGERRSLLVNDRDAILLFRRSTDRALLRRHHRAGPEGPGVLEARRAHLRPGDVGLGAFG